MNITLLADNPDAAPIIAQWYVDEWGGDSVEHVTNKLRLGINRNELPISFMVSDRGNVVGAGEIKYRELDDFPNYTYWLDGIYVKKSHRGLGISKKLIEFALSKAKLLGLEQLHLRCTDGNVKLYEDYGFNIVSAEGDKHIMGLSLTSTVLMT